MTATSVQVKVSGLRCRTRLLFSSLAKKNGRIGLKSGYSNVIVTYPVLGRIPGRAGLDAFETLLPPIKQSNSTLYLLGFEVVSQTPQLQVRSHYLSSDRSLHFTSLTSSRIYPEHRLLIIAPTGQHVSSFWPHEPPQAVGLAFRATPPITPSVSPLLVEHQLTASQRCVSSLRPTIDLLAKTYTAPWKILDTHTACVCRPTLGLNNCLAIHRPSLATWACAEVTSVISAPSSASALTPAPAPPSP